ncbi:MAG: hypothetical protein KTR31_08820 [Myxococcales bacterium]|nr:hypothetical protein [Myxococcales bacterium]
MWMLAAAALAQSQVSEEVVVYGDPFARWDDVRYEVQTELMLPLGIELSRRDDATVRAESVQIHAVLRCNKEAKLGKKRMEVRCRIEDLGLQAIATRWSKPSDQPLVASVLQQLDARMTDADVQLQVRADGGVPNVDLEGTNDSRDVQDRAADEALRALLGQVMAAFALVVPNQGTRLGVFEEKNPPLLRIPGVLPSGGSTRMVHTVSRRDMTQIVQTLGEGGVQLPLPNGRVQNFIQCMAEDDLCAELEHAFPKGNMLDQDARYDIRASGVAAYDRATGILSERIWQLQAQGRVIGANVRLPPYVNRGRLTQIERDARRDVGPTRQVAAPGQPAHGLPPWVPLEEP